jgi:hypothetical protein
MGMIDFFKIATIWIVIGYGLGLGFQIFNHPERYYNTRDLRLGTRLTFINSYQLFFFGILGPVVLIVEICQYMDWRRNREELT